MQEAEKFMINGQGHHVPVSMVKPEDKLENDVVLELYADAQDLSRALGDFKRTSFASVRAMLDLIAEKYGTSKGGKKGNLTLMSYDGLTRVQISIADNIAFGPQLAVAKDLIDECIKDWSSNTNDNIRALVDHAFRVDKNNRVNTQAILGLRRINITDDKWQRAMEAITDSVRIVSAREYIRFYRRESMDMDWKACVLDLAAV